MIGNCFSCAGLELARYRWLSRASKPKQLRPRANQSDGHFGRTVSDKVVLGQPTLALGLEYRSLYFKLTGCNMVEGNLFYLLVFGTDPGFIPENLSEEFFNHSSWSIKLMMPISPCHLKQVKGFVHKLFE